MYNNSKQKRFAQAGGLASVPGQAPNLVNIPLNQQAAGQNPVATPVMQGNENASPAANNLQPGVALDNVVSILERVSKLKGPKDPNFLQIKSDVSKVKSTLKDQELVKKFDMLEKAIEVNSDMHRLTRNPSTGEKELSAQNIAAKMLSEVNAMGNAQHEKDLGQNAQIGQSINTKEAAKKPVKDEDNTDKKKTRGNPFRVLMGQVGKLLDHGMSKRDIVKYLSRQGYWNEDTISKAVGVVKDYNKKKKKPEKSEKSKEASVKFNLQRYSQLIDNNETDLMNKIPFKADNDKGLTPEWSKRSTAELFARSAWLNCLKAYNKNNHRETKEAANLSGATSQQKKIRAELKKRGFTDKELP